MKERLKPP